MAKVQVGDLVCMYRRKNKGMGIVLEHVEDLIEKAEAGEGVTEPVTGSQEGPQKAPDSIDGVLRYGQEWSS